MSRNNFLFLIVFFLSCGKVPELDGILGPDLMNNFRSQAKKFGSEILNYNIDNEWIFVDRIHLTDMGNSIITKIFKEKQLI